MGARGSHSRANRRAKAWKEIRQDLTVKEQIQILREIFKDGKQPRVVILS